jgi:hypothetical protein
VGVRLNDKLRPLALNLCPFVKGAFAPPVEAKSNPQFKKIKFSETCIHFLKPAFILSNSSNSYP